MEDLLKKIATEPLAGYWDWKISDNTGYLSPSFKSMFGYEEHELSNTIETWHKLIHPEDLPYVNQNFKEHIESLGKIPFQHEARYLHKNGSIIWLVASGQVIEWSRSFEPRRMVGCYINNNKQKDVETQLILSEKQFKSAFDHAPIGMAIVSTEGHWIKVNKKICTLLGYSESELLKLTFQAVTHPDDLSSDLDSLRDLLDDKIKTYSMEKRYFHKNGNIIWVLLSVSLVRDKDGKPIHFVSQIEDITEHKKSESLLLERDALLSKLSHQIPGVLYQFQLFPNGKSCFPFCTMGIVEMFGLTIESIRNDSSPVFKRVLAEDYKAFLNSINLSYTTLNTWEHEFRIKIPSSNDVKWLSGISRPEKQADGSVIWHGYVTDITKRKQIEERLQNSFDTISHQNKRLLNFAHIVSHNLRSHAGNFEMVLDLVNRTNIPEEKEAMIEVLRKVSNNLSETIGHLNEVVSIQTNGEDYIEPIRLREYINKAISTLSATITTKEVSVFNNIPIDIVVNYNPSYLESILLNLLSNSIKYSHPGRKPLIYINFHYLNNRLVLSISDNGLGIDLNKYNKKLFGMYNTFHGNKDAKGIGLFITKNQVEAMGGKIEVESTVNEGSTFKIYLT
ncbi:PAS domain-containing protein [Chitinophagaceae bacterium LWZ2-11]